MSSKAFLRTATEAATRILGLASVCAVAADETLRPDVAEWLLIEGLWQTVSPKERAFLEATAASEQDEINFSWRNEGLYFLGWALRLTEELDPPREQKSTGTIPDQMPCPGESVEGLIRSAGLRPAREIHQASEDLFDAHAWCRSAQNLGQEERHGYDIEVARERHYAANWLVCHEDAKWDSVATDT
ncbi:MAG: hypothetical protein ACI8QC_003539 [Planctomycetota bacterium]|jgi:hypothetical protein